MPRQFPSTISSQRINAFLAIIILTTVGSRWLWGETGRNQILLERSDRHSCWFTVAVPQAAITTGPEGRTRLFLDGFGPDVFPGQPAVPSKFVFVAVPEGAKISLQAEPGLAEESSGIRLAPQPRLDVEDATGIGRFDYTEDREAYARPGYAPAAAAELTSIEPLRQMTVARIRINPVQYDPAAGKLRIFRNIRVKVSWDLPSGSITPLNDPSFDRFYATLLVNYQQAKTWARSPAAWPAKDGDPFDQSARWFRIPVLKEGIYRLDYGFLQSRGIDPATIDPRTIKIFNGGSKALPKDFAQPYPDSLTQCAVWVKGEEDGRFDPGDMVVFYGQDLSGWGKNSALATGQFNNPYCDTNVYWLGWGGTNGLRMQTADGEPTTPGAHVPTSFTDTVHGESDVYNPFNSGEIWYWLNMTRGNSEATKRYSLSLDLPTTAGGQCQLRISYRPSASGWHRMRWGLNGALARDLRWNGSPTNGELSDTASYAVSSPANRLDLELVKETADTSDGVHFNWFEAVYRRLFQASGRSLKFRVDSTGHQRHRVRLVGLASDSALILDISHPARPARIINPQNYPAYAEFEDDWRPGNRYLAAAPEAWMAPEAMVEYQPQRLRTGYLDARYLMIVPDELWAIAQKLAQHHGGEAGLQPLRMVKLSWIYNEFGFGLRQPATIRNFIKHIYLASNRTCPGYCLLFGNGNYDYRHLDRTAPNINLIPTYQGDVLGFELREYHFTAYDDWFAHMETSQYPQFAIARLPATGFSEAGTMVDKIIGYRSSLGGWRNRAILMADDNFYEGSPNSSEWIHAQQTEALSNYFLPQHFDRLKVYGCEYQMSGGEKPSAREALKAAWVQGASAVNFIGHGSYFVWGHERYLRGEDVPYLSCGQKLPFVLTASCAISRFDRISYRCINAALVALPQGGAIATFGDMREGQGGANFLLNQNVYYAIFSDSLDLGQSVYIAKYRTQSVAYNNRPYVLLGDPGIRLGSPRRAVSLSPSSDTLLGRGRYTVSGRVQPLGVMGSGQVLVRIFDIPKFVDSSGVDYYQPGQAVVQGLATVSGDSFRFTFNVPDLFYAAPRAGCRISAYAWGSSEDAAGVNSDTVWLGGLDTARADDHTGPAISLWADGAEVREGDFVSSRAGLSVKLSDPLGINIAPGIPEGEIRAWLDNEAYQDLGQSFIYDLDSDSSGQSAYAPRLESGGHVLTVRAYDCFGNYSTLRRSFRVADDNASLEMVYNYPNPTSAGTYFTFQLPQDAEVSIKIFTVAGRLIKTIEAPTQPAGYRQIYWDGRDEAGDQLANGVYLYKVTMKGADRRDSKYSKIVIMR
jgi:hypothetical protein